MDILLGDVPERNAAGPASTAAAFSPLMGEDVEAGEDLGQSSWRLATCSAGLGVRQGDRRRWPQPNGPCFSSSCASPSGSWAPRRPWCFCCGCCLRNCAPSSSLPSPGGHRLADPGAAGGALRAAAGVPPRSSREKQRRSLLSSSASWKALTSGGSTGRPRLIVARGPSRMRETSPPPLGLRRMRHDPQSGAASTRHTDLPSTHGAMLHGLSVVRTAFDPPEPLALAERDRAEWGNLVPTDDAPDRPPAGGGARRVRSLRPAGSGTPPRRSRGGSSTPGLTGWVPSASSRSTAGPKASGRRSRRRGKAWSIVARSASPWAARSRCCDDEGVCFCRIANWVRSVLPPGRAAGIAGLPYVGAEIRRGPEASSASATRAGWTVLVPWLSTAADRPDPLRRARRSIRPELKRALADHRPSPHLVIGLPIDYLGATGPRHRAPRGQGSRCDAW